jgi:hypothetical protein
MLKILIYAVLGYFAYRLFVPKSLQSGSEEYKGLDDEEYTDYEEVD